MPIPFCHATSNRFDGQPRVIAVGFQMANIKGMGLGVAEMEDLNRSYAVEKT